MVSTADAFYLQCFYLSNTWEESLRTVLLKITNFREEIRKNGVSYMEADGEPICLSFQAGRVQMGLRGS